MEYKSVNQLAEIAAVNPEARPEMSRLERLKRWVALLEKNPERRLNTFFETEYQPAIERYAMRRDDSPISVAFADPLLRGEGLLCDSYGEAQRFFDLNDQQLHYALCYCHHGATMSAGTAARALHSVVSTLGVASNAGVLSRLWHVFV